MCSSSMAPPRAHWICLAAWALGGFSGPASARPAPQPSEIRRLISAVREGPEGRRNRAAQRLYNLQDPRGNAAILDLAADTDPTRAAIGLRVLAIVQPPGAPQQVLEALKATDQHLLGAAIVAAGVLKIAAAAPRLERLLRHPSPACHSSAVRALARLGPAGLRGLRRALRSTNKDQRLAAASLLGEMRGKRARALLRGAADSAWAPQSLVATRGLLAVDDRHGYRSLARLLRHAHKGTRLQAISLLAEYVHNPRARNLLRRATRHADPDVRRSAADALEAARVERPR